MSEIRYAWTLYTAEKVLTIDNIYELEYVMRLYKWADPFVPIPFPNKTEWVRLREINEAIAKRRSQLLSDDNRTESKSLQEYWRSQSAWPKEECIRTFASFKGKRVQKKRHLTSLIDDSDFNDSDFPQDV